MGIEIKIQGAHDTAGSSENDASPVGPGETVDPPKAVCPIETVVPREHGLTGELSTNLATRLFTMLCGYRLMDVMSLLSGTCPTPTIVERGTLLKVLNLPVCGSSYT